MPIQRQPKPLGTVGEHTWYTPAQLADILNVSPLTIRNHIRSGKLPAYKIGSDYRITDNDVQGWIKPFKRPNRWSG